MHKKTSGKAKIVFSFLIKSALNMSLKPNKYFLVWLRNRLIFVELEPVLSVTEKNHLSYRIIDNFKMKYYILIPVFLQSLGAKKNW